MPPSLRRLKLGLIVAGLALALWPLPPSVSPWFFLGCIVLTGIPHGAIDHVLHRNYTSGPAWLVSVRFYGEYFLWIGAYTLLWWLLPQLAIVGFLLVSAYHFGQTQLAYLPAEIIPWQRRAIQLTWGVLVVGGFVFANSVVLNYGFTQVIPIPNLDGLAQWSRPYMEATACGLILLLVVSLHRQPNTLLIELIELTTLAMVFLSNDFYTSFGLFFGGWHALNAIHHSISDVSRYEQFSLRRFARESLVHSIASLGGIALIVWLVSRSQSAVGTELLIFIALSVLAFPHIVVLEQWYAFLQRPRTGATEAQTSASSVADPTASC
jgi:Brp/Blh family beta-carotene 15,15'-monooxygenase